MNRSRIYNQRMQLEQRILEHKKAIEMLKLDIQKLQVECNHQWQRHTSGMDSYVTIRCSECNKIK